MPTQTDRTFAYTHDPIPFDFTQSVERFYVEELPLFEASGRGEWLLLTLRKKETSTYRLLSILKAATGAEDREIGYAGLKDKSATAVQRITLPRRYEKPLSHLKTERIEILKRERNHKALRIGALAGNRFRILLTRLSAPDAPRFVEAFERIGREGFPNRFGYQRFGTDGESWRQGRELARSGKRLRGAKERLLLAAWQSRLFNRWLDERVRISAIVRDFDPTEAGKRLQWPVELIEELRAQQQFFKLFLGESMGEYPRPKSWRACRDTAACARDFARKKRVPGGLLPGERVARAQADARHLEAPWDDDEIAGVAGGRRPAWVWPEALSHRYDPDREEMAISFTLPPGAYATSLLEEIARRELRPVTEKR